MSSYNDELAQQLEQLQVPEPRSNAQHRILEAALAQPRRQRSWLVPLRRLRAALYVPQTRYAVMASIVALFIGIGALNQPASRDMLPGDILLYDLEFATFDASDVLTSDSAG